MGAPDAGAGRSPLWPAASVSAALAVAGFVLVIVMSAGSADTLAADNVVAVADGRIDDSVLMGPRDALAIAARNLGAIALLVGGAATAGLLTVVAVAVLGLGIGWGGAAAFAALGAAEALERIAPYVVFEFSALAVAAVAGLLPSLHALSAAVRGKGSPLRAYTDALGTSLALAAVAAALIFVAAAVEAIVIGVHPT